jgi:hypothetical protein
MRLPGWRQWHSRAHPPYSVGHVAEFHRLPDSPASEAGRHLEILPESLREGADGAIIAALFHRAFLPMPAFPDGPRHHLRCRQDDAGRRAVPHFEAPWRACGAVQAAEHGAQFGGHRRWRRDWPGAGAAGAGRRLAPHTDFNPVLLKPTTDKKAQVIIHGQVAMDLDARPTTPTSRGRWAPCSNPGRG